MAFLKGAGSILIFAPAHTAPFDPDGTPSTGQLNTLAWADGQGAAISP